MNQNDDSSELTSNGENNSEPISNGENTSEPEIITLHKYMTNLEQKTKSDLLSETKKIPEVGYLISIFQSLCNSFLLLAEVFFNFLIVLVFNHNIHNTICYEILCRLSSNITKRIQ
mgnify:CR=1 FL=1